MGAKGPEHGKQSLTARTRAFLVGERATMKELDVMGHIGGWVQVQVQARGVEH